MRDLRRSALRPLCRLVTPGMIALVSGRSASAGGAAMNRNDELTHLDRYRNMCPGEPIPT